MAGDRADELIALEPQQPGRLRRPDGGGPGHVAEQGDLAERFPRALVAAEAAVFEDLDLTLLDQVEAVALIALGDHLLAGLGGDGDQVAAEAFEGGYRQRREDRVATQEAEPGLGDRRPDLVGAQPVQQRRMNTGIRAARTNSAPSAPKRATAAEALIEPSAIAASRPDSSDPITRPEGLVGAEPLEQRFRRDLDEGVAEADPEPAEVGGDRDRPGAGQGGGGADHEAAADQGPDQPAASKQVCEADRPEQRPDAPGGVEEADAAVAEVEELEGEDDDQDVGEAPRRRPASGSPPRRSSAPGG